MAVRKACALAFVAGLPLAGPAAARLAEIEPRHPAVVAADVSDVPAIVAARTVVVEDVVDDVAATTLVADAAGLHGPAGILIVEHRVPVEDRPRVSGKHHGAEVVVRIGKVVVNDVVPDPPDRTAALVEDGEVRVVVNPVV